MDLKSILRRLPPQDGDLTVEFEGIQYPMPYETLRIGNEVVPGVRENEERLWLFEKVLSGIRDRFSLLDIGCNLGTTADHFSRSFSLVMGIEAQPIYYNLASELFPNVRFILANVNRGGLKSIIGERKFSAVLALSMIEYIEDKKTFVSDLFNATEQVCIVEGHSEDIYPRQRDVQYEALLKTQPWTVERLPVVTDAGLNAPKWSKGRPVWVCRK